MEDITMSAYEYQEKPSLTPRTDDVRETTDGRNIVGAGFARQLEREQHRKKGAATTDRTARQERNVALVQRIFAGVNARTPKALVLNTAEGEAQTARVERTRQSTFDLRDAFLRATGRPSADIDGAWQEQSPTRECSQCHATHSNLGGLTERHGEDWYTFAHCPYCKRKTWTKAYRWEKAP